MHVWPQMQMHRVQLWCVSWCMCSNDMHGALSATAEQLLLTFTGASKAACCSSQNTHYALGTSTR